jgi:hypothetical protein
MPPLSEKNGIAKMMKLASGLQLKLFPLDKEYGPVGIQILVMSYVL